MVAVWLTSWLNRGPSMSSRALRRDSLSIVTAVSPFSPTAVLCRVLCWCVPRCCSGPNWPEFAPLPAGELSGLLLSHAVHVMPSEREGFGHSINEGRAAGESLGSWACAAVVSAPIVVPLHTQRQQR